MNGTVELLDVGGLATERLEAEITTFAAHLSAAMCRWLLLVAEYDRRGAFEQWECVSMARWLGIHVGISRVTARQHVAVARRLVVLDAVRDAFGRGELSYSRVRAVCRIAQPHDQHEWVDLARNATAPQLERIVADTIRAVRAAQPGQAEVQAAARRLTWFFDDDGMCHVSGVLPPEVGALLVKLVATERDMQQVTDRAAEYETRNADAFAGVLARSAHPGDSTRAPVLVVVHRYEDGACRLEDGPPIPPEVADRLGDDAEFVTATHSRDAIRYGRRRRRAPVSMRRYLAERDRCCQFPGCGATRGLHSHHVAPYVAENGETVPENLILLCAAHHGAIHRRGWTVTGNPETCTLVFRTPDGRPYRPATQCHGHPDEPVHQNRDHGINPTPDTIIPTERGARYDHELTVWIRANRPQPDNEPHSRCNGIANNSFDR